MNFVCKIVYDCWSCSSQGHLKVWGLCIVVASNSEIYAFLAFWPNFIALKIVRFGYEM